MRRRKAFSLLLVIILLSGGLRDTSTAAGASPNDPPIKLVPADLIPPAMTTLAVEGDYAYVGAGSYLLVVDVSDPDKLKQVAYVQLPAPASLVVATSRLVYVLTDSARFHYAIVAGGDQVQIFDILNPLAPRLAGQVGPGNYYGLAAKDSRLYLSGTEGFSILDTSDPRYPVTLAAIFTSTPLYYSALAVTGNLVLLASNDTFRVLDVSDPSNPITLGELSGSEVDFPGVFTGLVVEGKLAAVAGFSDPIYSVSKCILIDLSDPAHPVELSSIQTGYNSYPSVALAGKFLYFTPRLNPIEVYDISNLSAPVQLNYGNDPVWGLASDGNLVYVAAEASGLAIYDSRGPDGLLRRGEILGSGSAEDLVVQGNSIYIADGGVSGTSHFADYADGGLAVAAIHPPEHAVIQRKFTGNSIPYVNVGHGAHVAVQGNTAYLSGGFCGLRYYTCYYRFSIWDTTQPEETSLSGEYPIYTYGPVSVENQTAYLTNQILQNGLAILDVSQPISPTLLSIYHPGGSSDLLSGAAISGTYGLVPIQTRGDMGSTFSLQVIDLSNPRFPTLVVNYPMDYPTRVDVEGSTGFITGRVNINVESPSNILLKVFDLSGLPQVQYFSEIELAGTKDATPHDVAYDGRYAYVALGEAGLRVVDFRDPSHPLEVFALDTPGNAVAVAQEGEWVYLADQDGGLLVFRKVRNFVYMPVVNVTGAP